MVPLTSLIDLICLEPLELPCIVKWWARCDTIGEWNIAIAETPIHRSNNGKSPRRIDENIVPEVNLERQL